MKVISPHQQHFPQEQIGSKYQIRKLIGKGSYGYVAEAKIKGTDMKVAIKKIYGLFEDLVDAKRILREIVILKQLNHPNLIKVIEIIPPVDWENFNSLYVVTEFCKGDLRKIFKSTHVFLQLEHIQVITYQILCGLKYLHSREILHRDLKPANILINDDSTIKICDFGLARSVQGLESTDTLQKEEKGIEEQEEQILKQLMTKQTFQKKQTSILPEMKKKLSKHSTIKKIKGEQSQKSNSSNLHKYLTIHITTRWYRAPQIILMQKQYDAQIDMWAIGCIFGQLLKMMKSVCPSAEVRFPLFPGKYCYPLSPNKIESIQKNGFPHSKQDQLDMIFSTIGTPSENDKTFITDQTALQYLKSFKYQQKANLSLRFPNVPKSALDFLDKCLQFDPRKRLTLNQALKHQFLQQTREKYKQEQYKEQPIRMKFETQKNLDQKKLRELFIEQIKLYNNNKTL